MTKHMTGTRNETGPWFRRHDEYGRG